ncbi:MAG: dihydrodipicolinate synthase family protein [Promethearchaeota archaeon]
MEIKKSKGLFSAPLSPLNDDGALDLDVIPNYADFLLRNDVSGVFVNGTTGESYSLMVKERIKIAEKWMESASSKLRVFIHVGHTSFKHELDLASHAQQIGAHAIGLMAPIYFRPGSLERLIDHCALVAEAAPDIPFYYYHIPQVSNVNFSMVKFLELGSRKIRTLAGIKFSYPEPMDLMQSIRFMEGKYDIMYGQDQSLLMALALGVKSAIGSTYNYAAPLYNELIASFNSKDIEKARTLQYKSILMVNALFKTNSFLSASKIIMKKLGVDLGIVREPLENLDEKGILRLEKDLEELGFFEYCSK